MRKRYITEFNKAIENINNVAGIKIIENVELNVENTKYDYMANVSKFNYKIITVNDFYLENSRRDKIYNTICHEFIHHILFKIAVEKRKGIADYSVGDDESPLFCLLVKWFNKNGFRIAQNYNANIKFKKNIEFINEMANKSFMEVLEFINEFVDYIEESELYIKISDIRKSNRNKNAEFGSFILNLGLDLDLKNYKEFIEKFI